MNLLPGNLPQAINAGIKLINEGLYFEAHEVLEAKWLKEKGVTRNLYWGLVQLSATLYHLERGNTQGAIKLLNIAEENMEPYEYKNHSIDLIKLLTDIQNLCNQISTTTAHESFIYHSDLINIKINSFEKK